MKARIGAVLLSLAMLGGMGMVAAPAQAAEAQRTHTCVDNYEWNHFYIGDGKNAVEYLFDTRGWTVWQQGDTLVKKYDHCGYAYSVVKVKYEWTGYRWVVVNGWRW